MLVADFLVGTIYTVFYHVLPFEQEDKLFTRDIWSGKQKGVPTENLTMEQVGSLSTDHLHANYRQHPHYRINKNLNKIH